MERYAHIETSQGSGGLGTVEGLSIATRRGHIFLFVIKSPVLMYRVLFRKPFVC